MSHTGRVGESEGHASILIVRAAGRACALPLELVIETMRPLPITLMAGAPPAVLGVAMIRGVPTVVVALAKLVSDTAPPAGRFVTVRVGARVVALAVDAVIGIRSLPRAQLHPLPPLLGSVDSIAAIAALDAELVFALRGSQLVPDDVVALLAQEAMS